MRRTPALHNTTCKGYFFHFPLLPASLLSYFFLAPHFRTNWLSRLGGLVTRWARLLITSNHYLPSTLKGRSAMRATRKGDGFGTVCQTLNINNQIRTPASSIRSFQAVSLPSTFQAQCCFTPVFKLEHVFPTRRGQRDNEETPGFQPYALQI